MEANEGYGGLNKPCVLSIYWVIAMQYEEIISKTYGTGSFQHVASTANGVFLFFLFSNDIVIGSEMRMSVTELTLILVRRRWWLLWLWLELGL